MTTLGIFNTSVRLVAISVCLLFPSVASADQGANDKKPQYGEGRIIAKPKRGVAANALEPVRRNHGGKLHRKFARLGNVEVIELEKGRDIAATVAALKQSGLFEYVEPDFFLQSFVIPNDILFTNQWGLHNTGQSDGIADADIDAPEAWDIETNANNVVVAVVDSGIRLDHEDLVANLWVNPDEISNGNDNDGNGYNGDLHGIDPTTGSGYPIDFFGHGTHVSGIIGARGNNGIGISGVAWQARIMTLKFLNPAGQGTTSDAIECLNYAIVKGAKIVNASWGNTVYSQALYDSINALRTNGIIFVAATGNSAVDLDLSFTYPAGYNLDNIVSVNATTRSNTLALFSDFGYLSTHLGAPGYQILSTYNTNTNAYTVLSGTSMAAPHVAGALALLRSRLPSEHYLGLIYRVLGSVDVNGSLRGKCLSDGQLNLHKLMYEAATSSPLNNNFTDRIAVTGERWTRFGRTTFATKEPGEPNHAGSHGGASIWWSWTAPQSGSVELTTAKSIQTNGAPLNTLLAVYTGSSLGNLTEVAANHDGNLADDGTNTSRLTFIASAGSTYQIAVDSLGGVGGHIKLALVYSPKNDSLASGFKLNGLYIACDGWSLGATKESNEGDHAGNTGGRSVWWSWRAPASGEFVLTTETSSFDTLLGVYTGSSHPLTLVATNDDDPSDVLKDDYGGLTSAVSFYASEGETYRIVVDGKNGRAGHIVLAGAYKPALRWIAPALGGLSGGTIGDRLNDSNQIAGPWRSNRLTRGYAYDYNATNFTDVGTLQGLETYPEDINNSGVVVGWAKPVGGGNGFTSYPVIWDAANGLRRLDQNNGYAEASAINDDGLVAGYFLAGVSLPCCWIGTNRYSLPVPFPNVTGSLVFDIDQFGNAVGNVGTGAPAAPVALLWRRVPVDNIAVRLADRLAPPSSPTAINRRGEIAGESRSRAVVWVEKRPKLIGHYGIDSSATALNNLGQFVGSTRKLQWGDVYYKPVLYQNEVQLFIDRLAAPFNLTTVRSINDNGLIVGRGYSDLGGDDPHYVFVMTPPEVILFKNPVLTSNDHFTVSVTGPAGITCDVEVNTDLTTTNWTSLATLTLTNGLAQFTDANAGSFANRFYRAKSGGRISANAAGFMVRAIPQGFSFIANPFHCADNRVNALLRSVPAGTALWKWDEGTQTYRDVNEMFEGYGWYPDEEMTLDPGDGAIVDAAAGPFTIKWAGLVIQNSVRSPISAGLTMKASQTAVAGPIDSALDFPAAHGDTIRLMTSTAGTYTTYTNLNGTWTPTTPTIKLGEGFFSRKAASTVWRQTLSVW